MTFKAQRILDCFVPPLALVGNRLLANDTLGHSLFSGGTAVRPTQFETGGTNAGEMNSPANPAQGEGPSDGM